MVTKNLMGLGPDLICGPKPLPSTACSKNTTGGISSTRNTKRVNPIDTTVFQELLQISPDIFEEFVLDDLVSKKPVLVKGKGVSKRKNTSGLIQSGLGMREMDREAEIFDVRISSRGRIIRSTRKM